MNFCNKCQNMSTLDMCLQDTKTATSKSYKKNVHENVFLTAKKVVLKFSIKLENAYSVGKQKK